MLEEFRKFVMRGNVLDLAVAVIIGAAFGSITTSLVQDVIMPPIGAVLGGLNFTDYYINLSGTAYASYAAAKEAGAPVIGYGAFITAVVNFLIVALVMFLIVRAANKMAREKAEAPSPPEPTVEEKLLAEIRDLLKQRSI